ncbi:hypothetical protein [Terrabacter sp. BE26]|uniref:hypothetical protein n=1 Tax=Terrabacter sp. BE26 TaxID=2898152 RepID=UPI0035BE26A4
MRLFSYKRREDILRIDDTDIDEDDAGSSWLAPLDVAGEASLASFRGAMRAYADASHQQGGGLSSWTGLSNPMGGDLYFTLAKAGEVSADYSHRLPVSICVTADGVSAITVEVGLHGNEIDEDDIEDLLRPMLTRSGSTLLEVAIHGEGNQILGIIRLAYSRRGAKVSDAVALGLNVEAFLRTLRGGGLTAESAFSLIAAGHANPLLGMPESAWLEVKSQGYNLAEDAGRIELGQDIARFANGDETGLLVIGFRTKKSGVGEVISKLTPSLVPLDPARYHRAIDAKVFPPINGLEIRQIEVPLAGGRVGFLLAALVPKQPEESKPVLVHGAIVGENVEGAFISIVQRRGEHSVPVTAQSIHSTLAAGRALLRRGRLPD